jgi:DNA polymerase-3 subunit delta'
MVSLNDLLKEFESISKDVQIHFLSYALEQVRQNLLLNYVGESLIRLNDRERAFSNKFSAYINHFNIDDLLKVISESQYYLERNVNVKLVFLQLSLKVHQYLNRKNYA